MTFVIIWVIFGLVATAIGNNKGINGCSSFLLGVLLGPIGILIVLLAKGDTKVCEYCKSRVPKEATACKHCGKDL